MIYLQIKKNNKKKMKSMNLSFNKIQHTKSLFYMVRYFHSTSPLFMLSKTFRNTLKQNSQNYIDTNNLNFKRTDELLKTNLKLDKLETQINSLHELHYEKLQSLNGIATLVEEIYSSNGEFCSKINDLDLSIDQRFENLKATLNASNEESLKNIEKTLDSKLNNLDNNIQDTSRQTEELKKELFNNRDIISSSISDILSSKIRNLLLGSGFLFGTIACVGGIILLKNGSDSLVISQNNLETVKLQKEMLEMTLKIENPSQINIQYLAKPTKFIIEKTISNK